MVGLSLHSIIPVRTEAKESAEQSTQILFGETFDVLEQLPRWNRVRLHQDKQEGWVDVKMVTPMTEKEYRAYKKEYQKAAMVAFPMAYAVSENNGQTIPLTAGTKLTNYREGRFEVLGVGFRIDAGMVIEKPLELNETNLQKAVRFFLNTPYLWGGKNALGMDCSGFTQTVMSLFGKKLLRNASEQVTQGRAISLLDNARAGDLVFFDHEDGKISHVGIILNGTRNKEQGARNREQGTKNKDERPWTIVHCSGRVKVERLDEKGVFSTEIKDTKCPNGTYTHHLVAIRRV